MEEATIQVTPDKLEILPHKNASLKSAFDYSITEEDFLVNSETENIRTTALKELKAKINCDKDVRYRTDDNFLLKYLRYAKFDVDRAYKLMRKFYAFRKKHPHVFSLSRLETVLKKRFITFLPYRDEENCLIFWLDYRNWDVDELTIWDLVSTYHAIADLITANPNIQIHGVKGIWDLRGCSLRHVAVAGNPSTLIFLAKMLQDIYPWKLKKIVTIYTNSYVQAFYNAFRYLLKQKIRDRIVLLGSDIAELHEHYDPVLLPKEYGGTLDEKECNVIQFVLENMDYLKYERSFGFI